MAVLAGLAGLAFRNRDKLTALVRRGSSEESGGPDTMPRPTEPGAGPPSS